MIGILVYINTYLIYIFKKNYGDEPCKVETQYIYLYVEINDEQSFIFHSLLCPGNISYYVQLTGHNGNSMESFALHATLVSGPSVLSSSLAILIAVI